MYMLALILVHINQANFSAYRPWTGKLVLVCTPVNAYIHCVLETVVRDKAQQGEKLQRQRIEAGAGDACHSLLQVKLMVKLLTLPEHRQCCCK